MRSALEENGHQLWPAGLDEETREILRLKIFSPGEAGTRSLLDHPVVAATAASVGSNLIRHGLLPPGSIAIQAIAFNKSADTNWKVTWHQDLLFPISGPVDVSGWQEGGMKDGIHYARPPLAVLRELLAVRVHLDDCGTDNGPLRVISGSHHPGIIPSHSIPAHVACHKEMVCTAGEGEALLMRPLLLHASSKARVPRNRRVLHLVFHSGAALPVPWHSTVPAERAPASNGRARMGDQKR